MKYIGIDLHSNNFACCFLFQNGHKKKHLYLLKELPQFVECLASDDLIMVEASTNTFSFVERIRDYVSDVYVANPYKLKLISMVKKKTDKIDAEKLAIFLKMQHTSGEQLIRPVYIPEKSIQQLRSLFTTYKQLRKQVGQTKNRIHAIFKQALRPFTKEYIFGRASRKMLAELGLEEETMFQVSVLLGHLEHIEETIKTIESRIKVLGSKYYKQIDLLTSMKGISIISAIAIMADVATIDRFPNSKHFSSYLRSAPGVDSSNNITHNLRTNRAGRKLSVVFLSQALNHFRDSNTKLNRWYNKKVEVQGQKKGKIRMALCRRVFVEIYQMLKKGEYHYWRDEKNHKMKMEKYDRFLIKQEVVYKRA